MAGYSWQLHYPNFAFALGSGMLVPVLPLYLRDLGFSFSSVTTVIAGFGIGALLGQIPFGYGIARYGKSRIMFIATLLMAVATAILGLTPMFIALLGFRVSFGFASTGWILSRHAFMATGIPTELRGRTIASMGGITRIGFLVGPVIGGLVAERFGFTVAFVLVGIIMAIGVVPFLPPWREPTTHKELTREHGDSVVQLMKREWRSLWASGVVQICVLAARDGRLAVVPLLGAALGLDVGDVGLLVAVGAASDLLLFPVSGILMDRFGRQAALVPFLVIFGSGLVLAGLADTPAALMVAAGVIGFGNGLGAGTMLTMGADLAPAGDESRFLALFGTTRDIGRIGGPMIVGWMGDAIGLSASAFVLAALTAVAVIVVVRVLGDTRLRSLEQGL